MDFDIWPGCLPSGSAGDVQEGGTRLGGDVAQDPGDQARIRERESRILERRGVLGELAAHRLVVIRHLESRLRTGSSPLVAMSSPSGRFWTPSPSKVLGPKPGLEAGADRRPLVVSADERLKPAFR